MSDLLPVGRVGRPHGRDGSFHVERAAHALEVGTPVTVAGRQGTVERRLGGGDRPIVGISGVADREGAANLRGEPLLIDADLAPLAEGEWLTSDLVGCRVPGLGVVRRVISGPSCDLLEVGDGGVLVPLVGDAVRRVDTAAGVIEVDHFFLGGGGESPDRPS